MFNHFRVEKKTKKTATAIISAANVDGRAATKHLYPIFTQQI